MISAQEFKERWEKCIYPLVKYSEDDLRPIQFSKDVLRFLCDAGLPESAAPFLNFESPQKGGMRRMALVDDEGNLESGYVRIGFDGSGNTICFSENTMAVLCIDHEDSRMKCFMNSSIIHLAEFLLLYAEFIRIIKAANGRRAFLEKGATVEQLSDLKEALMGVDLKALECGAFWEVELKGYEKA